MLMPRYPGQLGDVELTVVEDGVLASGEQSLSALHFSLMRLGCRPAGGGRGVIVPATTTADATRVIHQAMGRFLDHNATH